MSDRRGLPCRADECDVVFQTGKTTDEIVKAGELRNAHEVEIHGYRHKTIGGITAQNFTNVDFTARRRARRMQRTW